MLRVKISTLAGTGQPGATDAADPLQGKFNDPAGVTVATGGPNAGTIYVADWGNNSIRRIKPDGTLDTFLAGKPNLIVNPRAEQPMNNGVPGWTSQSGSWIARSGPLMFDGSYWFWGGNVVDSVATQTISLTQYQTAISQHVQSFRFSGMIRGHSTDRGKITVTYQNSSGSQVSAFDSPWVTSEGWTEVVDVRLVPTSTRQVKITLTTNATSGTAANAYFDGLELRAMPVSGDGDRGLIGPNAVQVAANGDVIIGGEGVSIANAAGTTLTPLSGAGGYTPPKRVSAISIVPDDNFIYFTDPTDPLLHVRSAGGFGYYANVTGGVNDEPIAVTARGKDATTHRLWVAYRSEPKLYQWECPTFENQNAVVAACSFVSSYGAASTGMVDDMDGTVGGERFGYFNALLFGPSNDLLIADESNHALRRSAAAYTRTLAGGVAGFIDGHPALAKFWSPSGIALQGSSVVVADRMNNAIRRISCGAASVCAGAVSSSCEAYPVDDNVECTTDLCEVLAIRHTPKTANAFCSDGNSCNGVERCDAAGVCQPAATTPTVDDGKGCSIDACNPVGGVSHVAAAAGTPCTSTDPCRPVSSCDGSSFDCPVGPLLPTDDANDCTVDACGATGITHTLKATGASCKLSAASFSNDGTCDPAGACIPTNIGSLNQGPIDRTVVSPVSSLFDDLLATNGGGQGGDAGACVNSGSQPSCAFIPSHMALIRGTVADTNGAGIAGASISVVGHPEFGTSLTLANGEYFMVVNGGSPVTIRAQKSGLLRSDRLVNPAWGGTDLAQDIVLVALDTKATPVAFAASGLATSVLVSGTQTPANLTGDTSKARTAAVYFPPSVKPSANGAPITSTATFRVTEYTAGGQGRARMPADVAANTLYTYAAEFTLEDAAGNVYDNVTFPDAGPPVYAYVSNFMDFSPGTVIPVGYYDRQTATWQPMKSGQVMKIDSVSGGVAAVSGVDPATVTLDERTKLGAAYAAGTTLWRLPVAHFSPLDFNIGVGTPSCETQGSTTVCPEPVLAQATGGDDSPACGSCQKTGSIIDVERQVLRETFPIVGTPFSLNYSSENTLGYAWNKTLGVNLDSIPKHSKLRQFVIDFKVAGKRVSNGGIGPTGGVFPDWTWPKSYQTTWDGRDQDGRIVQGAITATLDVGAVYTAEPRAVSTFGSGNGPAMVLAAEIGSLRTNPTITLWTRRTKQLQVWDASALGFGGWTIDVHHAYDPSGGVLYLGDGTHRKVDAVVGGIMLPVAGAPNATPTYDADGTSAASAAFRAIRSLAVTRDGEVLAAIPEDHVIRKISVLNGQYTTVRDYAGKGNSALNAAAPDAGPVPAVGGYLSDPVAIALHNDGRLVIADRGTSRIYEVSADGATIRTIAGNSTSCPSTAFVDGTPAKSVGLCFPSAIATGPDGSVYFVDERYVIAGNPDGEHAARIDPSGALWLVAGKFASTAIGPTYYRTLPAGTTGPQMGLLQTGITVDQNNTVWLSTDRDIVAVPPGGAIRDYPMPLRSEAVDGPNVDFAMFQDGSFLRPNSDNNTLQRCTLAGSCTLIAGGGAFNGQPTLEGAPANRQSVAGLRCCGDCA